jgi:hypothetical protein
VLHDLHHLLPALGGELREGEADHGAVVARGDPEVGGLDGLLDRLDRPLVVGRDDEQARLGNREPGQLLERDLGAVVVDLQLLDEDRAGPPRPDRAELALEVVAGLRHLVPALGEDVVLDRHPAPFTGRRLSP